MLPRIQIRIHTKMSWIRNTYLNIRSSCAVQVRNKRAYIAELIRSLAAAQNPGKELKFLELQFQADSSSNGGGGMADDDMEDDEVEDLEEGQAAPLSRHVKVKKVYFFAVLRNRIRDPVLFLIPGSRNIPDKIIFPRAYTVVS
jgi:hypothetical protein